MSAADPFQLSVITAASFWDGEVSLLNGLLEAGLIKLHIRKQGAAAGALESLLDQLAPRWAAQLVLHGSRVLARQYGIPQVHTPLQEWLAGEPDGRTDVGVGAGPGTRVSLSLHSWEEYQQVAAHPCVAEVEYVWISPLFDCISKPGYLAGEGLLAGLPPARPRTPRILGLGGVDAATLPRLVRDGWDGAAVLGYLWEQPEQALERWLQLNKMLVL